MKNSFELNVSNLASRWYPITRDCLVYGITVILLIIVLNDEKVSWPVYSKLKYRNCNYSSLQVYWYESLIFLIAYLFYILLMFFNTRLESSATSLKSKFNSTKLGRWTESSPLLASRSTQFYMDDDDDDGMLVSKRESNLQLHFNRFCRR